MIQTGEADSVGQLLTEVKRINAIWTPDIEDPSEVWFRGESRRSHQLLPVLFRDYNARFHYDESTLFERFRILAAPHVHRSPLDDWDWYFLARHHGLPSRLLDWSESLVVAAYFALCEHFFAVSRLDMERQLGKPRIASCHDEQSPCIWMLDAGTLNDFTANEDTVYVPGGARTNAYLPASMAHEQTAANARPIAVLPPRKNERLAAQQGVFTLHGHDRTSLDELAERSSVVRLACVSLDKNNLCQIWDELQIMGVGRLGVFPELDSVAAHVAWICQSEK